MAEHSDRSGPNASMVRALIAFAVCAIVGLAVWNSASVFLFGDEFHSVKNLRLSYGQLFRLYDQRGSGIAFPLLQKACVDAFGAGPASYRLPALIGGVASVLLMFPVAKRLVGAGSAVIATLALATNAVHVYYTGFGRAYSLVVLLALVAAYALMRAWGADDGAERETTPRRGWLMVLVLAIGTLAFLHLTSLGLVLGLALAVIAHLARRRAGARAWTLAFAAFLLGGALSFLLHAGAWESLTSFLYEKAGDGDDHDFGPMDVAVLLFGGHALAWIGITLSVLGAILALRRATLASLVLVAATCTPFIAVVVARPIGQPYAYARYVIAALPFLLMLEASAVYEVFARLTKRPTIATIAAALSLAAGPVAFGPLGFRRTPDGPFASCETTMHPLPAFDAPWDERPRFYAQLAALDGPLRILEVPDVPTRSNFLYRSYRVEHGHDVTIGTLWRGSTGRPYLRLPGATLDETGADYLIVHINLELELARYWGFAFEQDSPTFADRLMSACSRPGHVRVKVPPILRVAQELERILGAPVYRDRYILAWDLARAAGTDAPLELSPKTLKRKLSLDIYTKADELTDRGVGLAQSGRIERALATFASVLELVPDHAPAILQTATALGVLNRFDESEREFERTLALNPYSPEAHLNYALVLESRSKLVAAREHFDAAVELDPSFAARVPRRF